MCDCKGVSNIFSPTFGIPGNKVVFGNGSTLPSLNVNLVLEIMRVRLATYDADVGGTYFSPNILQIPGAPASIDGVLVELLDRILIKDQTNEEENGVYQVISVSGPTVLQRVADFRPNKNSTIIDIEEGVENECTLWYNSRDTTLTVGIDPIKFIPMSGGGTGSVIGIPPTVIDNIVLWADETATTIKDSGVSINDILDALNQIVTVTLTGTAYSIITTETEGSFLLSVKNDVTDGPAANFSITKNEPGQLPSITTITSAPGVGTGEFLELQWNTAGDLELHKTGINYDGDYTVTIFGNATISGGGDVTNAVNVGGFAEVFESKVGTILNFRTLQAGTGISITQNANDLLITNTSGGGTGGEIAFQLIGLETIINNPLLYIPIAYLPWDPVEYASYSNGRLTVNTNMTDLTFDIRFSTATLGIVDTFNVLNLGITRTTTFNLSALPVLEDRLVFEVIQTGAGIIDPSMFGMSLRFDQ